MSSPFAIFSLLPIENIDGSALFGLPHQSTLQLPDGQVVPTATPGHPETVAFYEDIGGHYLQVTREHAIDTLVQLHDAYGTLLPSFPSALEMMLGLEPVMIVGQVDFTGAGA